MANTINTIKSTIAKAQRSPSVNGSAQKPQSQALAGPTQSGVQGVGAKPTPKRPDSERKPSIVTNHVTKPGMHEDKESELTASRYLGNWLDKHKEHDPNHKDDYFSHQHNKIVKPKPRVGKPVSGKGRNIYENRETLHPDEGYKHGDIVHWQEPRTSWHSGIDSGTVVTKILRNGPTKYHIKRFHDGSSVEKYHHEIIHYHRPVNEDAPVMAAGGASDPGLVQNPTVNYAASLAKKVKKVIAKRKMPK